MSSPFRQRILRHRMAGALAVGGLFLAVAWFTRLALLARTPEALEAGAGGLLRAFGWGALYDAAAGSVLVLPAALYLALLPQRVFGTRLHAAVAYLFYFALGYALLFVALAEWTFWGEFETRFNFIAVDYLVYTREVIGNILESYPVPALLAGLLVLTSIGFAGFVRTGWLAAWSRERTPLWSRLAAAAAAFGVALAFGLGLDGRSIGDLDNQYLTELGRNGPYSFFAAFRNNELPYERFYRTIPEGEAFQRVRGLLGEAGARFGANDAEDLRRRVENPGPEQRLNVVQITVESLSAKYLGSFGSQQGLTPNLDALARESLRFSNFFATGNRTVRGMEALTLGLPPTPGTSVVKRPHNENLFSLGSVFLSRGYDTQFLYGGFGYFDNMNAFFSGNGYRVIDRAAVPSDAITFANVWGAADEDLFHWALQEADRDHAKGQPFFQFVMTTSNHRPFTYPDGRIDIPSGTGRRGAVKYTDWAIGEYIRQARTRPWFRDTIFVIVADHTAGTSGRVELPPRRYRIPLLIHAPGRVAPGVEARLCSQIDFGPTLLSLLGWSYDSRSFGRDVLHMGPGEGRALIATYQSLGYLKDERMVVLRPGREVLGFRYEPDSMEAVRAPVDEELMREAIAHYQTAGYLLEHGLYQAFPAGS
jgi:phosphoglycerol transferase MdoB-like AlkP superfamily enzyme